MKRSYQAILQGNQINKDVGRRIRKLRLAYNMSLKDTAKIFGISFQQMQKYEQGHNRIAADKLFILAKFFKVKIGYFYYD